MATENSRVLGECELRDVVQDGVPAIKVKVIAEAQHLAVVLEPEGFGNYAMDGDSGPVMLELHQGQLRLLVWGDINQEEPTHIISLEDARHSARKEPA